MNWPDVGPSANVAAGMIAHPVSIWACAAPATKSDAASAGKAVDRRGLKRMAFPPGGFLRGEPTRGVLQRLDGTMTVPRQRAPAPSRLLRPRAEVNAAHRDREARE